MISLLTRSVGLLSMLPALVLTPYALTRIAAPRADLVATLAVSGALAIGINSAILVLLHAGHIAITSANLATAHAALLLAALAGMRWRRCAWLAPAAPDAGPLLMAAAAFAVLVIPFTYLAGVDTYKWQDLATNVAVSGSVPWLIHPAALFGFTPRSYPSAQPLTLATVQVLGRLGVDGGFYVVSVLSGTVGILSAGLLGRRLFDSPASSWLVATLYAFSPVFVRYSHWATGRGFFLALYPLFLLALLGLPRARSFAAAAVMAVLLALCHKTGGVAVVMAIMGVCASLLLPRSAGKALRALALLALCAAACVVAPSAGSGVLGAARACVTRFGWLAPAAAVAWIVSDAWLRDPRRRRLLPLAALSAPLACASDMYGAMVFLPLAAIAATDGALWLAQRAGSRAAAVRMAALALSAAAAVVIVVHRSCTATPGPVRDAARFLECYDSQGPFRLEAPPGVRESMQAYLSGCPRFRVGAGPRAALRFIRPPGWRGDARATLGAWTAYGRALLSVTDTEVDWYGENPRVYRVVVGDGAIPAAGEAIYSARGVRIYKPAGQSAGSGGRQTP